MGAARGGAAREKQALEGFRFGRGLARYGCWEVRATLGWTFLLGAGSMFVSSIHWRRPALKITLFNMVRVVDQV